MSNTQLNKEFSERDIQRMRNIIGGNTASTTRIQTGYTQAQIKHVEGDIWEENKKTWTIKNGIKQTVTKHDALKAMVEFPLVCPCCNNPMICAFDNSLPSFILNRQRQWSVQKVSANPSGQTLIPRLVIMLN